MIITVTRTFTNKQALILAKEKGYQDIIPDNEDINKTINNTESSGEFLKRVYEQLCIDDATKYYLEYEKRLIREEQIAKENLIKETVIANITSSIE